MTDLKEKIDKNLTTLRQLKELGEQDDLENYQGRWKLLYVFDNGSTFPGPTSFDSEEQAILSIENMRLNTYASNSFGHMVGYEDNSGLNRAYCKFNKIGRHFKDHPWIIDLIPIPFKS